MASRGIAAFRKIQGMREDTLKLAGFQAIWLHGRLTRGENSRRFDSPAPSWIVVSTPVIVTVPERCPTATIFPWLASGYQSTIVDRRSDW